MAVKCPKCRREVSTAPVNKWRFRSWDVSRLQCPGCKTKFNSYKGPKSTFTIPKSVG